MKKIYMVWREGGDLPKVTHYTWDSAQDEAARLAEKHPGVEFHITASVDVVKTDAPVIEVGDVVRWSECRLFPKMERIVTWAMDKCPVAHVQFKTDMPEKVNVSDLTLIRKGPKVHNYKGIKGKYIDVPTGAHTSGLRVNLEHGKRYTLTLTEEEK